MRDEKYAKWTTAKSAKWKQIYFTRNYNHIVT